VAGLLTLLLLGASLGWPTAHAAEGPWRIGPGQVLLLRHALAPGTGDPPGFRLGDCSTQRNLDANGRRQARRLGDWLRERGVTRARVYSSQWCRCLETAKLLALGPVTELPALNSFFGRPQDQAPKISALETFLRDQPMDGDPLILVTHQVTITALTGIYPRPGDGVLLNLVPGEAPRLLGPVPVPQD
jgi:broad specificity phosphatase PhoE